MLDLPILNVRLHACSADWQQMTPTQQGRHCQSCNRTVVDFTTATQADLEDARAASPDGRLCGRFRESQLALAQVQLRPKLRKFVVALVLVCGLGLTSGEAWAQVRKARVPTKQDAPKQKRTEQPEAKLVEESIGIVAVAEPGPAQIDGVRTSAEQMPEFKAGGVEGSLLFIKQNLRWPAAADVEGRVFVQFIVGKDGHIRKAKVIKGIHPLLDAEALRLVQLLDGRYQPGRQNGQAVDVYYTLPISFSHTQ